MKNTARSNPQPVEPELLAELFRVFSSSIRCVVLNACNSAKQAKELVGFVDAAVGMDGSISTGAGRAFVTAFYQALAYGKDVATAFDLGRNQISLEDNPGEEEIPQLYVRQGINRVFPADSIVNVDERGFAEAVEETWHTYTACSQHSVNGGGSGISCRSPRLARDPDRTASCHRPPHASIGS